MIPGPAGFYAHRHRVLAAAGPPGASNFIGQGVYRYFPYPSVGRGLLTARKVLS